MDLLDNQFRVELRYRNNHNAAQTMVEINPKINRHSKESKYSDLI